MKVLFVCLGNICRSPMAEAVFRQMLREEGLDQQIKVQSAATSHWEVGHPPHKGTLDMLKSHHISSEGLVATQVQPKDFEEYDYIIGMDRQNISDLKTLAPLVYQDKIFPFLSVVPECSYQEVPDPYYTGDFELTYELVVQGCQAWLNRLKGGVVEDEE